MWCDWITAGYSIINQAKKFVFEKFRCFVISKYSLKNICLHISIPILRHVSLTILSLKVSDGIK